MQRLRSFLRKIVADLLSQKLILKLKALISFITAVKDKKSIL